MLKYFNLQKLVLFICIFMSNSHTLDKSNSAEYLDTIVRDFLYNNTMDSRTTFN